MNRRLTSIFPSFLAKRALLAAVPLVVLAGPAPVASASTLACKAIPKLMETYVRNHIRFRRIDAEMRQRVMDSFIDSLDPSKTLFLADEAESYKGSADSVFNAIQGGDCSALHAIHEQAVKRYEAMEGFVRETMSDDGFAIDPELDLVIDPDKRGYAATRKERDDLIGRLVHFQISNYLVEEENALAEAKKRLTHRYELMTLRAKEVDQEDLYASFLDAFARSLDPHSSYFSPDALEDFQIGMALSLEGIGVALSSRDGYPVVEQVIPGGATDRTHALLPKDKIIAVAQEEGEPVNVVDMSLRDVVRLIRGKKGTDVRLTVLRQEEKTRRFHVTITRDTIDLKEQAASLRFETRKVGDRELKLAVIELRSFYGDKDPRSRRSTEDVARLLETAREQEADGLLLDLSRNGGGNLEYAVAISGFFIREGGIVAIRESSGRSKILRDPDDDVLFGGPMVVLTSRLSASASEILAGALKDYGRAVLVGDEQTFGKGTVQTVIPLQPGLGALKVTTAMFFRPGGNSTQRSGVEPHLTIPSLFDRDTFGESNQDYALPGQSMVPFLTTAAHTRNGKRSWAPVTDEVISQLEARSKERIAASQQFAEVLSDLAEAEANQGVVKLAEILQQKEESEALDGSPSDAPPAGDAAIETPVPETPGEESDELSLQAEESLNILADLVQLSG